MTPSRLTPRPYQEDAIQRALLEPTHGVLIASGLGSGKTLVATEIALRLRLPRVLIVAPRNTLAQWADRFAAQSEGQAKVRRMDSTRAGMEAFADFMAGAPGFYSMTSQWATRQDFEYKPAVDDEGQPIWKVKGLTGEVVLDKDEQPIQETERFHLKTFRKMKAPVDVMILDEMHILQNRRSITFRTLQTIPTDWRIGMSATWHGNGVSGAWSSAKWVWPTDGIVDNSYHRWVEQYCITEQIYVRGKDKPVSQVVGERIPGEFASTLPCYIRDMPFDDAPPPSAVYVDITPAQRAQYQQLEEEMVAWAKSHLGTDEPIVADLPIVLRARLRTATLGEMSLNEEGEITFADDARSAKLTALRGVLDAFDREAGRKEPAIIFTDSRRFVRVVHRRMRAAGYKTLEWTGDATEKQREEMKRAFMEGEADYIVATIPALSEGLDGLQLRCSKIVWLSYSEDQLKNQQSAARIWRPGVDESKFKQVAILARDTLDDSTYLRLSDTRRRSLALMGDSV